MICFHQEKKHFFCFGIEFDILIKLLRKFMKLKIQYTGPNWLSNGKDQRIGVNWLQRLFCLTAHIIPEHLRCYISTFVMDIWETTENKLSYQDMIGLQDIPCLSSCMQFVFCQEPSTLSSNWCRSRTLIHYHPQAPIISELHFNFNSRKNYWFEEALFKVYCCAFA